MSKESYILPGYKIHGPLIIYFNHSIPDDVIEHPEPLLGEI